MSAYGGAAMAPAAPYSGPPTTAPVAGAPVSATVVGGGGYGSPQGYGMPLHQAVQQQQQQQAYGQGWFRFLRSFGPRRMLFIVSLANCLHCSEKHYRLGRNDVFSCPAGLCRCRSRARDRDASGGRRRVRDYGSRVLPDAALQRGQFRCLRITVAVR